jgi:hypothetical protein
MGVHGRAVARRRGELDRRLGREARCCCDQFSAKTATSAERHHEQFRRHRRGGQPSACPDDRRARVGGTRFHRLSLDKRAAEERAKELCFRSVLKSADEMLGRVSRAHELYRIAQWKNLPEPRDKTVKLADLREATSRERDLVQRRIHDQGRPPLLELEQQSMIGSIKHLRAHPQDELAPVTRLRSSWTRARPSSSCSGAGLSFTRRRSGSRRAGSRMRAESAELAGLLNSISSSAGRTPHVSVQQGSEAICQTAIAIPKPTP